MRRREMIKAGLAVGLLGTCRPDCAAEGRSCERVIPITGPDHPLASKKTLVYGLGETAANFLGSQCPEEYLSEYWLMFAGVRNGTPETEVMRWGTGLYPFHERNTSRLSILARLGDRGADLIVPTVIAWRERLPVEVFFLDIEASAEDATIQIARKQWAMLSALSGLELVRVGRSEDDAEMFFGLRSGWLSPEDA